MYEACLLAYRAFLQNPDDPRLARHPLKSYPGVWAVYVTRGNWRACYREGRHPEQGAAIVWFFLGDHATYNREFRRQR